MENQPITLTVEKAHYLAVLERAVGIRQAENEDGSPINQIIGKKLSMIGNRMLIGDDTQKEFEESLLDVELIIEYFHLAHS